MTEQPQNAQPANDQEEADIAALLANPDTADGPGTDDLDSLPPSDFESFADSDVEVDDNQEASQ